MTLQRYIPTFFQAVGTEERWAGMREDSQDGAWYAAADVDQRIATLEAALRTIAAYRGKNAVAHQLAYLAEAALDLETQPTGNYTDSIDVAESFAAETGTEPTRGVGQKCHLCHNVHDLMSACPPVVLDAPNSEWRFTEGRECGACGHWIVPGGSSSCSLDHAVPETVCDPTMQHGPECPILHGYACNCTPIPLDHK